MTLDSASLGSFGDLAIALGILEPGGSPNGAWFEDPMSGGGAAGHRLKTIMADLDQREALVGWSCWRSTPSAFPGSCEAVSLRGGSPSRGRPPARG